MTINYNLLLNFHWCQLEDDLQEPGEELISICLYALRFLYSLFDYLTLFIQFVLLNSKSNSYCKVTSEVSCHVILLGQDFTEVYFLIHSIKTAGAFHKTTKQLKFWLVRYLCMRTAGDTLPGLWSPSGYVHKGDQFCNMFIQYAACFVDMIMPIWLSLGSY